MREHYRRLGQVPVVLTRRVRSAAFRCLDGQGRKTALLPVNMELAPSVYWRRGPFCRAHPFRREAAAEPSNSKQTNSVSSADISCAVRETGGVGPF
jgi:hypothetical protein